jgi:hypothetical protein
LIHPHRCVIAIRPQARPHRTCCAATCPALPRMPPSGSVPDTHVPVMRDSSTAVRSRPGRVTWLRGSRPRPGEHALRPRPRKHEGPTRWAPVSPQPRPLAPPRPARHQRGSSGGPCRPRSRKRAL